MIQFINKIQTFVFPFKIFFVCLFNLKTYLFLHFTLLNVVGNVDWKSRFPFT